MSTAAPPAKTRLSKSPSPTADLEMNPLPMPMTPELVAQRVDELIESILHGTSWALAEHSAAPTIDYIEQMHHLGIINAAQFQALVIAVNEVADGWELKTERDGKSLFD